MTHSQSDLRFATFSLIGATMFIAATSIGFKFLGDHINPAQSFFFRNIIALSLVLVTSKKLTNILQVAKPKIAMMLLRGTFLSASLLCLFLSFQGLELATATAIHFAFIPMASIVTAAAGSRSGDASFAMLMGIISYVGALLIIQPQAFSEFEFLAYATSSAIFACTSLLILDNLGRSHNPSSITFFLYLAGALLTIPTLPFVWVSPQIIDYFIFAGLGISGWLSQILLTYAISRTSNLFIAPFQLIVVVFVSIFDLIFWGTSFGWLALLGMVVIITSTITNFIKFYSRTMQTKSRNERKWHAT